VDPRILTDWEYLTATSDDLLNLDVGHCDCEGRCLCEED
jgi:hypothetical protein